MRTILIISAFLLIQASTSHAQLFHMKKSYTGYHYSFSSFDPDDLNKFVVGFNRLWADDLASGFSQYDGNERGQNFSTSGFRLMWGKRDDFKWTASTDYAYGWSRNINEASFENGITQEMRLLFRNHQIINTFGIVKNEDKVWIEAMYCTNLATVMIEYSTTHLNDVQSFGTEYKLNGLYEAKIKTMEFGLQLSYKYKKYVMYTRAIMPIATIGPDDAERIFVDARSSQAEPNDFPSDYDTYVNDPQKHVDNNMSLTSNGFKGFSLGIGMIYLFGKDK